MWGLCVQGLASLKRGSAHALACACRNGSLLQAALLRPSLSACQPVVGHSKLLPDALPQGLQAGLARRIDCC